jgi:uncharacterized membrane protein
MSFFRYGIKSALVVGVVLMIADAFIPLAHEFGAWPVGCLLAVCYSVSAVMENDRMDKRLKRVLYVYFVAVFVIATAYYDSADAPSTRADWSMPAALKAVGVEKP